MSTIAAGIDVGSLSTEVVILQDGEILSQKIGQTGANSQEAAKKCYHEALEAAGLQMDDVEYIISTGYGRISTPFAHKRITEITCHGRGMYSLNPDIKSIIDIGGQDSKAINLDETGKVNDFVMNDKCAAGTGRFLEVMAAALEVDIEEFSKIGSSEGEAAPVTSMCTVFAESEVVSLIAQGYAKEKIIRGLVESIGERTETMAQRISLEPPFAMSGGVAKNKGVVKELEKRFGASLYIPHEPQIVGALGAAIFAEQKAKADQEKHELK